MEILIEEKYNQYTFDAVEVDAETSAKLEKAIAVAYSGEGKVNFILDILKCTSLSDAALTLFHKIQKISSNESGLFIIVCLDDDHLDQIASNAPVHILTLPTVEEAVDAIFMNELENEFKDGGDNEFDAEADY